MSLNIGSDRKCTPATAEGLPRPFGDYQLVSEIARGGMGVVYRACHNKLKRTVALKLVLAGQFASRAAIDRFRAEAEAAAALQHPNIISIHEVGETEGQPYFTMELIEGSTLTDLVRSRPLPPQKAATYAESIARAVGYAHECGVLHRDLKPSNVLIDAFDQPRITDFGLAKRAFEDSHLTLTGQTLGSPGYMAPEQASTRYGQVSAASDVYSLGAVLYHLITGRAPFAAPTLAETLQQALHNEPLPPRTLNPDVPLDLETICLKCLEKEPRRRYVSARTLADELARYLRDEPIIARPTGRLENLRRWCRHRPVLATLVASSGLLALVLIGGASLAAWRIEHARQAEKREHQEALRANADLQHANARLADTVTVLESERAEALFHGGDSSMALAQLAAVLRRDPSNHIAAARIISSLLYHNWVLPGGPPLQHPQFVTCVNLSRSGRYLLTGCADGLARVWGEPGHQQIGRGLSHRARVHDGAFSPDETSIATGAEDGNLRIWDWRAAQLRLPPLKHPDWVFSVSFSPDGERVVTACADSLARVWAAGTGELLLTLPGHFWAVRKAVFSPDGKIVATGGYDATARLWDSHTGQPLGSPLLHGDGPVLGVAFSPDGNWLATACRDRTARLWNAQSGMQAAQLLTHPGGLNDVGFDPTGRFMVTSSFDNTVRIWDTQSWRLVSQPFRHAEQVNGAVFLLDGRTLATASDDRLLRFWNVRLGQALSEPMAHQESVNQVEYSSSGDLIATASDDKTARIWSAQTGLPVTGPLLHTGKVQSVCFSPDNRFLVTASSESAAVVWEVSTGKRLEKVFPHDAGILFASFSPDGRRLVTTSEDQTARIWDFDSARLVGTPLKHKGEVLTARFSPDGTRVVTASRDETARVWDATTGVALTPSLVHGDRVHSAIFSPDGLRVATASADNTARIWDARTGQPLGRAMTHLRTVRAVAFSPDGRRLVTASLDRTARVWDAFTGAALTPPMEHHDALMCVEFSPDGTQIATGSSDHTARIWDAKTGLPLSEAFVHRGPVVAAHFGPNGARVVTAGSWPDNAAHLWCNPAAPASLPAWLVSVAEAVAGLSFPEQGTTRLVSQNEFEEVKQQVTALAGNDDFTREARWFFADRATRTLSPFDSETISEYVQRRLQENTHASLEEAVRLDPTNSVALSRLAKAISVDASFPQAAADALNLARLALSLDPSQAEAGEVLAGVEAQKALAR